MAFGPGGNQQPETWVRPRISSGVSRSSTPQHDYHDEKSITAVEDEKI
jgi:hypothetical protein